MAAGAFDQMSQRGVSGEKKSPGGLFDVCLFPRQSGAAMIVVLMLTSISSVAAIMVANMAKTELRISHNDYLAKQALAIAEGGIAHAFQHIRLNSTGVFDHELKFNGTGGSLSSFGSSVTLDGKKYRAADFANGKYYIHVEDNHDEQPENLAVDSDLRVILYSRGVVEKADRTIEASVEASPAIGLFGRDYVTVSGGSVVDSFDAATADYDPLNPGHEGHVSSNGNITVSGVGTTIDGDARATGSVINGGVVTGDQVNGAPLQSFPSVPPCAPFSTGGMGFSGGYSYALATGDLSIDGTTTFTPGTYCFHDLKIVGAGELIVDPTASAGNPVRIYLTGTASIAGNGIVNNGGIPESLQFNSSANTTFTITGNATAYLRIYAPDADIKFSGGTDLFGGAIGKSIEFLGGMNYHYDQSLGQGVVFVLGPHREVKN